MTLPTPRQTIGDIALCLVFFTRLPLPRLDFAGRKLAAAIWAAPIAGLAVALIGSAVYGLAIWSGLGPGTAAALTLAATMLATGCLHEDGLSDVADGFGGGKSREKKLEIMRDSRIGTYGASALIVSALLRWSTIADLASPMHVCCGLVAAHVASRGMLPAFMHLTPQARADGLAATAGSVSRQTATVGAVIGALALFLLGPLGAMLAVLLLGIAFTLFRSLCLYQIGGHTGDTVGALQQIGEIIVLVVASAIFL
jgi:adenosylcobinamide-GDP ribazoletransferase